VALRDLIKRNLQNINFTCKSLLLTVVLMHDLLQMRFCLHILYSTSPIDAQNLLFSY